MTAHNLVIIARSFKSIAVEDRYGKQFSKSHGITLADALIASAARKNAIKLWTLNRKHYPMLAPGEFWETSSDK